MKIEVPKSNDILDMYMPPAALSMPRAKEKEQELDLFVISPTEFDPKEEIKCKGICFGFHGDCVVENLRKQEKAQQKVVETPPTTVETNLAVPPMIPPQLLLAGLPLPPEWFQSVFNIPTGNTTPSLPPQFSITPEMLFQFQQQFPFPVPPVDPYAAPPVEGNALLLITINSL
jgi:hypothetical protein